MSRQQDWQFFAKNVSSTEEIFLTELGVDIGAALGVQPIRDEYTGAGVSVAVVDDGFALAHGDLSATYDTARDWDWRDKDDDSSNTAGERHGTAVMGVVGADDDGVGATGVAPGATLAGLRIGYGSAGHVSQYAGALRDGARFDVVNSSWGYNTRFSDNFEKSSFAPSGDALDFGVREGRDGLGTVYTFAAGNARQSGDDVNHHNYQNAIETIAVAATQKGGQIATFSTPGAAILVSAPGVGVLTSDLGGSAGYGSGDTAAVSGTSFAAPAVAGVAALMLEANPLLGWRDVMEILALSATQTDPGSATWQDNAANGTNGGGFWTSRDYGFGLVDARAAVRLAESWDEQKTSANMVSASAESAPSAPIPDLGAVDLTLAIVDAMSVEQIELRVDIDHAARGNLIVTLISPSGTESVLIDRPAVSPGGSGPGDTRDDVRFTLTSNEFWGETAAGVWTVRVTDAHGGNVGSVTTLALTVHGDAADADDRYVYTDAFAIAGADAARRLIDDAAGVDTINAAALSGAATIDLVSGMTIAGHTVSFQSGTVIEHAYGGEGDDTIAGNGAANHLAGARGDDHISGREGDDRLEGGRGSDTIDGGVGEDTAIFAGLRALYTIIADAAGLLVRLGEGSARETDALFGIEWLAFDDVTLSLDDLGVGLPPGEPVNTDPQARDDGPFDAVACDETPVALQTLLANDTDADGDILHVSEIVSVSGGVALLADNALRFTGATAGEALVVYRVSDGAGGEDEATVRFVVTDPPPPPPATIDAASFAGLNLWFDTGAIADGDAGRLADRSGRGADAVAGGPRVTAEATADGLVFDGTDVYRIADTSGLNVGGPFDGKTLVFTIETGADVTTRQVLYEQGGTTRGLSVYVEDGALVMAGWNVREAAWGVVSVSQDVAPSTRMSVALTFDAVSGTLTGSRDGTVFGVATGADRLYDHSDDIGLGGVRGYTLDANGSPISANGDRWTGTLFEMAAYDRALDADETEALLGALNEKWGADDTLSPSAAIVPVTLTTLLANDSDADGDAPLVDSIDLATGGTAQIVGDHMHFSAEMEREAGAVYRDTDGNGGSDEATVCLAVEAPPPVAYSQGSFVEDLLT